MALKNQTDLIFAGLIKAQTDSAEVDDKIKATLGSLTGNQASAQAVAVKLEEQQAQMKLIITNAENHFLAMQNKIDILVNTVGRLQEVQVRVQMKSRRRKMKTLRWKKKRIQSPKMWKLRRRTTREKKKWKIMKR